MWILKNWGEQLVRRVRDRWVGDAKFHVDDHVKEIFIHLIGRKYVPVKKNGSTCLVVAGRGKVGDTSPERTDSLLLLPKRQNNLRP